MSISLRLGGVKSKSADQSRSFNESAPSIFFGIVGMIAGFFRRFSANSRTIRQSAPIGKTMSAEEPSGKFIAEGEREGAEGQTSRMWVTAENLSRRFIARESFNRGNDVVVSGDDIYRWRPESNIRPTFIALRSIKTGETVVSDPADLERSDLMTHWELTYNTKVNE